MRNEKLPESSRFSGILTLPGVTPGNLPEPVSYFGVGVGQLTG